VILSTVGISNWAEPFVLIWLPFLDTYRTMCLAPEPAVREILEGIRDLRFEAPTSMDPTCSIGICDHRQAQFRLSAIFPA
jgi:hypothetical protein